MSEAETIAVVVHGVGDHSASVILSAAAQGFRALTNGQTRLITLNDFPQPNGEKGDQTALELEAGAHKHLIVPVIWSGLSSRASRESLTVELNPVQILTKAMMPLMRLCIDALRCIPLAAGVWWKTAMAFAAVSVIALLIAVTAASFYFSSHVTFWFGVAGTPQYRWYSPLLVLVAVSVVSSVVRRLLPLFDYVADVVTYVGRAKRRANIETTLARIVDETAHRAPHARIVVAGHSLGSVLVTHAVREAQTAAGRLIVLTLGSPLRLLSRVFPRQIASPDALLASYAETGNVLFWANLWRDRDVIGRDLKPAASGRFVETSIGNGVHWDMWHDLRVWRCVDEILGASSFASLQTAWKEREEKLSDAEIADAATRLRLLFFVNRAVPPAVVIFAMTAYGLAVKMTSAGKAAFVALNVLIEISLLAMAFRAFQAVTNTGVSRRTALGDLRRGTSFCGGVIVVIALASLGCSIVIYYCR